METRGCLDTALHTITLREIQQTLDMADIDKVGLIAQVWDFFIHCEYPPSATGARWDTDVFGPTFVHLLEKEQEASNSIIELLTANEDAPGPIKPDTPCDG